MATIRCWALHGNIQRAIDYVTNPDKTEKGLLIESNDQNYEEAGLLWKAKEKLRTDYQDDPTNIVGYHFQQSFPANSITPEEALEISKQWIEELTNNEYDYVLSVHTDQADRKKNPHIHTHIIVNPRSNKSGKKLEIFYKKDIPKFKAISDRICVEHGKEILKNAKGMGKSYYEWMMENQGDGLKQIVAKTLDTVIPKVRDYEDLKTYLTKLGFEIEDNLSTQNIDYFDCTADISLINEKLSKEENYFIHIPRTKEYISVNKKDGHWLNNDKTYSLRIKLEKSYIKYDREGNPLANITGEDLRNYFEDKTKLQNSIIKIKVTHSKKFIRCHRIDKNENGEGYSLDELLQRIEDNGKFVSDSDVLEIINNESTTVNLNEFYEQANIKTKWMNSRYYKMSKKERYFDFKLNEIQNRLNAIHDTKVGITDIANLSQLKENRDELQKELKHIQIELSKQENLYEQIQMDKLSELLEVSEKELDDFAKTNIIPLQNTRRKLKKEITDLNIRIKKAETKLNGTHHKER